MRDLNPILSESRQLIKQVATFLTTENKTFDKSAIEFKGLNDLVSYVDKAAEKTLVDGLRKILPEAGFITEEGTASNIEKDFNWIIDPLDGTTNFIHGLPIFAVSVALTYREKVVMGIVHEANRDECFYAMAGEKAYCNDKEISVSSTATLSESLIATGFPYYNFSEMEIYLKLLEQFMQKTHGLRRMGSAAVDLAYVACGRFEGFFEYNLNAWDVAAGAFIVQQAGGKVTDFKGEDDYVFGREIVAGNACQAEILSVIQKLWKQV